MTNCHYLLSWFCCMSWFCCKKFKFVWIYNSKNHHYWQEIVTIHFLDSAEQADFTSINSIFQHTALFHEYAGMALAPFECSSIMFYNVFMLSQNSIHFHFFPWNSIIGLNKNKIKTMSVVLINFYWFNTSNLDLKLLDTTPSFFHWFPSNSCHHNNGNGQPLILNNVDYLEI